MIITVFSCDFLSKRHPKTHLIFAHCSVNVFFRAWVLSRAASYDSREVNIYSTCNVHIDYCTCDCTVGANSQANYRSNTMGPIYQNVDILKVNPRYYVHWYN